MKLIRRFWCEDTILRSWSSLISYSCWLECVCSENRIGTCCCCSWDMFPIINGEHNLPDLISPVE